MVMLLTRTEKVLSALLLAGTFITSIFISPSVSLEPIDQPKLLILVVTGFAALGLLLSNWKKVFGLTSPALKIILGLFTLQLLNVLIYDRSPFVQQFYGASGRNTGFLCYLALGILLFGSAAISSSKNLGKFTWLLITAGALSIPYDLLQTFNHDPIKWNNQYNSILGFLGNPDFESSFVGMVGVSLVALVLAKKFTLAQRFSVSALVLLCIFVILRSHAQQGMIVFLAGSAIVGLLFLRGSETFGKRWIVGSYSAICAFAFMIITLGAFKIGPLTRIIYKESVTRRGFYWHAAIKMMNNHPINGIGLDSYGDWYLQYRSKAAFLADATKQSNAAHNVFLDFGANGGWPLFILNLALFVLAGYAVIRYLRREKKYGWHYAAILGAWVAYVSQAIISINQIGLVVWGWVFTGLLIGHEFKTRQTEASPAPQNKDLNNGGRGRRVRGKGVNQIELPIAFVGLLIGILIMVPYFRADANFRKATQIQKASAIVDAAYASPRDENRMLQAAQLFLSSKMPDQALEILHELVKSNPRNYNAWVLLSQAETPNSPGYIKARAMMQAQNPLQPLK